MPRLLPVPACGPDEVLVRVHTAGVGIWDVKARRGEWASGKEHFPIVLGADGSGTVAAVGADVQGLAPGDHVYGYHWRRSKSGFYAEYVTLGAEHVAPIPASLGLRDAGGIAVSGLTALAGIDDALALRGGETVLVYGATGGVGSVAVQLAQRRGAHVIATARGADGVAYLRRLGIVDPIDVQNDGLQSALREAAPEGIDAVLALAGGAGIGPALDALRSGGRVAYPNGVTLPTRDGNSAHAFDGVPSRAAFARLSATIDAGPFEVPIGALFALDEAADAHRLLERGHVLGKVVLAVDELEEEIEKVA
ncbi:MAG TPA: NADP-dependent oxidoreductase [Candidatus Elarobacter sp.]